MACQYITAFCVDATHPFHYEYVEPAPGINDILLMRHYDV